ncbi:MAG: heparan-alpha-glucosaminide N-acetyltransferase domain-containing protein [Candidatus Margulisiibacteriota bacterium]
MESDQKKKRDVSIDIMRGIAILTMVAANMSAYVLIMPPPFLFRFFGTFAAPLFIMLSGLMIALKGSAGEHDFRYYLERGLLTLGAAALIDVFIWHTLPFISVDVLYTIGVSMPLAYLFLKLSDRSRWAAIFLIFLLGPVFRWLLGYQQYDVLILRPFNLFNLDVDFVQTAKNWIADGFFPLFPWLGFSFLGPVLQKARLASPLRFGSKKSLLIGLFILASGAALWAVYPGPLLIRENYSELFYFPTIGYIVTSIGIILTLFSAVDLNPGLKLLKPLQVLGESSLFTYIFHLALIKYLLGVFWPGQSFDVFIVLYALFMLFLIATAYGIRYLKGRWSARPFLVKFLIG